MPSPTECTIPASRLRVGDALIAHGDGMTVVRPPVVSADGSMLTAVVARPGDPTARLVRVPVDQPVTVLRGTASDYPGQFVRQSKVVKSSGAQVLVLDLCHPESEIQPIENQRFATLCVAHHSIRFHSAISTAEALSSHPEEWCPPCGQATGERAQSRLGANRERRLA